MKNLIYLLFIVILAGFLDKVSAQDSIFYYCNVNHLEKYPEIEIQGRITKSLQDNLKEETDTLFQISISENNEECELLTFKNYSDIGNIDIHLILNGTNIKTKDIDKLWGLSFEIKSISDKPVEFHWYTSTDQHFAEISFDSLFTRIEDKSYPQVINPDFIIDSLNMVDNSGILNVIFLHTRDLDNNNLKSIQSVLDHYPDTANLLFGITYNDTRMTAKEDENLVSSFPGDRMQRNTVLCSKINNQDLAADLETGIYKYINSFYYLSFRSNPVTTLMYQNNYLIELDAAGKLYREKLTLEFPEQLINESYVVNAVEAATILSENTNYEAAIIGLYAANRIMPQAIFNTMAKENILKYKDSIIADQKDPDSLFRLAEDLWGYSAHKDEWYFDLKLELLNIYYDHLPNSAKYLSTKKNINKQRLELTPDNQQFILTDLELEGDIQTFKRNYSDAVDSYNKYLKIKKNKSIGNKLNENVRLAIDKSYDDKDFELVYNLGIENIKAFEENFKRRYYFAEACMHKNDYQEALDGYEWLINNWTEDQKYITWEKAFKELEVLYSLTNQYDKAMELNQRYYRDTGDEKLLLAYLKNLRLKYFKLVSDALPVFIANVGANKSRTLAGTNMAIINPEYLNGIYILDNAGNISFKIYENDSTVPPKISSMSKLLQFPAKVESNEKIWLINKAGSKSYAIIEFTINTNLTEDNILSDIRKKKLTAEPWKMLNDFEQKELIRFSSQFITGMITREMEAGKSGDITPYWNRIKSNNFILYMVKHDKDGEIVENCGFEKDLSEMEELMWKKSSKANAYYLIKTKYDQHGIEDISNPIFINYIYYGTIRIGCEAR